MTVLSSSVRHSRMLTVQCDLCSLPLMITNREDVIAGLGWQLASRGAAFDACQACLEARDGRSPLSLRRQLASDSEGPPRLPDLVMIGAAKSGTTSMHHYLDAHPDVFMTPLKELRFFSDPHHLDWLDAYRRLLASGARVVGESSTMYTRAPAVPGVAQRMAALVPDARLLYLVRDPARRAVASYLEERVHGLEPRSFEEAFADLDDPYNPYVAGSRYGQQLEQYLTHFRPDQIAVVSLEDLADQPAATLRRVFSFLGVDPDVEVDTTVRYNAASGKVEFVGAPARLRRSGAGRAVRRLPPTLRRAVTTPARRVLGRPITRLDPPPALLRDLNSVLAADADKFRQLTGRAFRQWSAGATPAAASS